MEPLHQISSKGNSHLVVFIICFHHISASFTDTRYSHVKKVFTYVTFVIYTYHDVTTFEAIAYTAITYIYIYIYIDTSISSFKSNNIIMNEYDKSSIIRYLSIEITIMYE